MDGGEVSTTVSITRDGEQVFIDVTCSEGDDVSMVEAIGIVELGKALLLEQA